MGNSDRYETIQRSLSNRIGMAGTTLLIAMSLLIGGCAEKTNSQVVIPPGAKATMVPTGTGEIVASSGTRTAVHPETPAQALNDPNVPAAAKAMIKAHMH